MKDYHQNVRDTWEKVFSTQEWGQYPAEPLIRFIAQHFYNKKRDEIKILEIGCGPGPNIWYLAREGFNAYGIDISETAIDRAKLRLKKENLQANLYVGDVDQLPFPDNQFDGVIDNECLMCNTRRDTELILKEIKRVTKDNGLFFSRTFTDEMYTGKTKENTGYLEYDNISDGLFANKGFLRLTSKQDVDDLYGKYFKVQRFDIMEYKYLERNKEANISEWIIVCKKERSGNVSQ